MLQRLFEAQRKLDEHIEREHQRQEGEDRLAKKILALMVELGELANEYRGFKFWSNHQEPRTNVEIKCPDCDGYGVTNFDAVFEGFAEMECKRCNKTGILGYANPLLEEYVDCLHFILSIGLETGKYKEVEFKAHYVDEQDIVMQFNILFGKVSDFYAYKTKGNYQIVVSLFLALGEMLGFTWDEVEEAYMKKNAVNHQRQENGY